MTASDSTDPAPPAPSRNSAFRHRGFLFYWISRFAMSFATQIISVAVGWQVYDLTRDPFDLGIVGLVQFLPSLLLVLITGAVADRYNRRGIMAACCGLEAVVCAGLLVFTWSGTKEVWPIFALLVVFGVARAFMGPAVQSLLPNLVPPQDLSNAIAWNSSSWQIATITGPVAGGLLYGLSEYAAFGVALVLMIASMALVAMIPKPVQRISEQAKSLATLFAGFRYVWSQKIVLGAISLDLFAVLLGGATALLPMFASDILHAGPWGLGFLRAAPAVGALAMSIMLARRPLSSNVGRKMLAAVAVFGVATIVFSLSTNIALSAVALLIIGASDTVSVVVRSSLVQLLTPDEMRGRVSAVNSLFIGTSNQLGEFESGMMAAALGPVATGVVGGLGTIVVVLLWMRLFPDLAKVKTLQG
jgi:MFS family permease